MLHPLNICCQLIKYFLNNVNDLCSSMSSSYKPGYQTSLVTKMMARVPTLFEFVSSQRRKDAEVEA